MNNFFNANLAKLTQSLQNAINDETNRQANGLELIASENFVSEAVLQAMGSVFTNKYAEGYPKKSITAAASLPMSSSSWRLTARKRFSARNTPTCSRIRARRRIWRFFWRRLQHGDKILGMNLSHGGHLTHGHPMNFSGINYEVSDYGVSKETETIDYDELQRIAEETRPKMIICGASAYPRTIDFQRIGEIAKSIGAR
jgi:glycine hydroxymethyltransferase